MRVFLFWILVDNIQANNAGISITSKKFLKERIMINEINKGKMREGLKFFSFNPKYT
jgi:hypothetical protein